MMDVGITFFIGMKNITDSFYILGAKGPLSDFAVTPDIFERAVRERDFSKRRDIHMQLCWGEYLSDTQFPIVFHPCNYSGKQLRDVVSLRYGSFVFLISDKFKSVLEDNEVTGWKSYPVEIYGKKGEKVLGYNGFSVIGRGGALEGAYSAEWDEICKKPFLHYRFGQWDGSDIFRIYPAYLMITKRVKDLLIGADITGVKYTPISERILLIK